MRIVHTVNVGFCAGGAEKFVSLVAAEQLRQGHEVRVVATDVLEPGPGQHSFADALLPAPSGGPGRLLGYFWNRGVHRSMRELIEQFQPDVVHHHTIGEFSPSVLAACRGRAQVMSAHGPEDWTLGLLKWNLATATRPEGLSGSDRLRYARLRWIQRPAYRAQWRHVNAFLAVSRFMAETIAPDVGAAPVFVVPNCSEPGFEPTPITDPNRVLYSGRLERVKGVHHLLDAFRKALADHPSARLVIAGEGTQRPQLEQAASDLVAAGAVRFLGWLPQAALAQEIALSSLVVVPSLWPEVFGRAVLDAFGSARPVIASRIGGLPELVDPSRGALVEPGDADALAAAMSALLGDQPELERLGEAARGFAQQFSVERVAAELDGHYARAIGSRRPARPANSSR
jgi:glycosyltransferase involved in cell wall biosynthesis